jgi:hypothetical protein
VGQTLGKKNVSTNRVESCHRSELRLERRRLRPGISDPAGYGSLERGRMICQMSSSSGGHGMADDAGCREGQSKVRATGGCPMDVTDNGCSR